MLSRLGFCSPPAPATESELLDAILQVDELLSVDPEVSPDPITSDEPVGSAEEDSECVGKRPAEEDEGMEKLRTPAPAWRPQDDEAEPVREWRFMRWEGALPLRKSGLMATGALIGMENPLRPELGFEMDVVRECTSGAGRLASPPEVRAEDMPARCPMARAARDWMICAASGRS